MSHLTCREFVDFLDDYLDGNQPETVVARFDEHIERCSQCHDYLVTYRDTIRLAKCLCSRSEEIPPDVPPKLIEAVLSARRRKG